MKHREGGASRRDGPRPARPAGSAAAQLARGSRSSPPSPRSRASVLRHPRIRTDPGALSVGPSRSGTSTASMPRRTAASGCTGRAEATRASARSSASACTGTRTRRRFPETRSAKRSPPVGFPVSSSPGPISSSLRSGLRGGAARAVTRSVRPPRSSGRDTSSTGHVRGSDRRIGRPFSTPRRHRCAGPAERRELRASLALRCPALRR